MKTLAPEHRRQLERVVADARDIAETGARAALEALAVDQRDPFEHMSDEQRALRRRLRAHARHLGDRVEGRSGEHGIDHLTQECAYEHWHAMLFARFLAENALLIHPELEVDLTLEQCGELAKAEGADRWALASRFAQRMLPQVFRPDHPVFGVRLAREHRVRLEELVEGLATEIFTASDALGWVYQFWQARKKDEVNRSEVKIGADELPAVTQLFTEPYMVEFLLHNSLGAWWETRHPDKPCPADATYLRHADDGQPAAGTFDGWPDDLSEFRLLDPCCGSGHFLVAALLMLVPMRMALEGLAPSAAVDAVLGENLHGLEIDQRCVAIAAFALALEAWRYPNAGGYRKLPRLNLAWCGQPVAARKDEWLGLADGDPKVEAGMAALHDAFRDAPTLGSLIDPVRSAPRDMLVAGFDNVRPLLAQALERHNGNAERQETAIAALGIAEAAEMLTARFHLVVTNVPYLARGKHGERLREFSESRYARAKNDLANVFLERCLELASEGGMIQVVMPQNWLFLKGYKAQRLALLRSFSWDLLARLGPGAFATISGEVVKAILLTLRSSATGTSQWIQCIDTAGLRGPQEKAEALRSEGLVATSQRAQLLNPDAMVRFDVATQGPLLGDFMSSYAGVCTGDYSRFGRAYWEVASFGGVWEFQRSTVDASRHWGGMSNALLWERNDGSLRHFVTERLGENNVGSWIRGHRAWDRHGVVVKLMGDLPVSIYRGELFDDNVAVLVPKKVGDLGALFTYCASDEFAKEVRKFNQKVAVKTQYLLKIPFDREHWAAAARAKYPSGLPKAYSDDPTQWIFHGHPCGSVTWNELASRTTHGPLRVDETVLHVAIARLLGYRWPAEHDPDMELADDQRELVVRCAALHQFQDEDGIVCIPSVRGERPASERLLDLIRESYENWKEAILARLLDGRGNTLDDWLRNRFFDEHCKLFRHRPFIWHVWDGRKRDGFHALVNYHRLAEGGGAGRQLLESLAYSYLGDWIARQRDGVVRGEAGSDDRLAAALHLQRRLAAILEGEPPFDLFVRWKPLPEQAIGWNPNLDDGVRLNIRPFLADDIPGGKKGAGILRSKPNVHWRRDRGKEPLRDESEYPWFWADGRFTGERVNDRHFSNAEKRAARNEAH